MKITAINGSPKMNESNSEVVLNTIHRMVGNNHEWSTLTVIGAERKGQTIDMEYIIKTEVLLFAFPLYVDGIPSPVMKCMERCSEVLKKAETHSIRLFAVVNCGFHEGIQNATALEMMKHFAGECGLMWSGGVGIGTGEMIAMLKKVPPNAWIKKPVTAALQSLATAIVTDSQGSISKPLFTQHALPRIVYKMMGEFGWRWMIKKNGLDKKTLNARPYLKRAALNAGAIHS